MDGRILFSDIHFLPNISLADPVKLGILCFHFHSGKIVPHVIMISSLASELFQCVLQINQTFEDFQLFFRYQFTACSHGIYT